MPLFMRKTFETMSILGDGQTLLLPSSIFTKVMIAHRFYFLEYRKNAILQKPFSFLQPEAQQYNHRNC